MAHSLSGKTLGIIHSAVFTANIVQKFTDEIIPDVSVLHFGDDSIQRDNLNAEVGVIPRVNFFKFVTYAHFLQEAGCDLILLGCSTFNQAVEHARPMISTPMLQIDRPMMELAVEKGDVIGLLATLPSTVPASERILRQAAADAGKSVRIETILCGEAFQALRGGDVERHNELLLGAIDQLQNKSDAIVMAQVSMSLLEPYLSSTRVPVFNSARTGFTRVREILESQ
jgi:aspartate/glutamate racemase